MMHKACGRAQHEPDQLPIQQSVVSACLLNRKLCCLSRSCARPCSSCADLCRTRRRCPPGQTGSLKGSSVIRQPRRSVQTSAGQTASAHLGRWAAPGGALPSRSPPTTRRWPSCSPSRQRSAQAPGSTCERQRRCRFSGGTAWSLAAGCMLGTSRCRPVPLAWKVGRALLSAAWSAAVLHHLRCRCSPAHFVCLWQAQKL